MPSAVHLQPGRSLLRALVSLPTHSAALNLVPLLVNTVLFCWTMDLLYTPSYFFPSDDLAFVRCVRSPAAPRAPVCPD